MMASEIERLFASLQTTHHEPAFERAGNQCSQFLGINDRADLASASPLLRNQLEIKPRTDVFTPMLAKHSKSFSLIDCISVGVDRMQRNSSPCESRWRPGRGA